MESYNGRGTEESATETLHRRRRSIPLQNLEKDFKFYEQKADLAENDLPYARTTGDETEAKLTFE